MLSAKLKGTRLTYRVEKQMDNELTNLQTHTTKGVNITRQRRAHFIIEQNFGGLPPDCSCITGPTSSGACANILGQPEVGQLSTFILIH